MSVLPTMDDFASLYRWVVGASLAVGGYFIRDLHTQYKEHLQAADARNVRLAIAETNVVNIVKRLDEINSKLDELIQRGN